MNSRLPLLLAAGIAVVACGPAQQPAADTTQGSAPRSGGQLNTVITDDPWDWDLTYTGKSVPNGDGQGLAYSSLLGFKVSPDVPYGEFILQPEIAERWEVSPDAKTFTFELRKGVKFANVPPVNGREITSADVKWSYDYQNRSGEFKEKKLPAGGFNWMFEGLNSIDTPDPYKVVVKFDSPFSPFIKYTGSDWNPIFPKEIYEQDGHMKDRIIGSGPFLLDQSASQKGSRWVWKKNPNYFEAGKPYIDELRWLVIPEQATALAAFQTKQIDWLGKSLLEGDAVKDLKSKVQNVAIQEFNYPAGGWISFNTRKAPLDKKEVRQAFLMAIDRDEISQTLFGKKEPWALAGAFDGLFTQEETKAMVRFDPEGAKRLLAQAGYANGLDLDFEISGNSNPVVELMQAQLKKVGINIKMVPMPKEQYSPLRKAKKHTIQWVTWACASQLDDQDTQLYACYYSKSAYNDGGIEDAELDKHVLAQRAESDEGKRKELHRQAVRRITEMSWAGSMFYPTQYEAWHPHLKNYSVHAASRPSQPWQEVWLEK